jgi:hypothetical protein
MTLQSLFKLLKDTDLATKHFSKPEIQQLVKGVSKSFDLSFDNFQVFLMQYAYKTLEAEAEDKKAYKLFDRIVAKIKQSALFQQKIREAKPPSLVER